ncbi:MmpS family transport accessory protein [[Mycobacterium] kokjensenii]|uniref:MmpS family transport accessory protein n=1 Tax=[Mycobacterium] kokjensenii TaxID=3064287 RepID=A0ABM9LFS3_9MYCO|nr:MmpS family transport accessory protein [Mycolicibacter sp. MU0083]CAJ1498275.1 MmpS family transport accessory protein [Mycolicibacter sp. MU0083]
MGTFVRRSWLPVVVVAAAAAGALAVVNLRGAFGSDEIFRWTGSGSQVIESSNEKQLRYEVFGPGGASGAVSFLNDETQPEQDAFVGLPWTHTMTTTSPSVIGNLVAQSDGEQIGCRITVNGVVKDEQVATGHHAQVFCLVKGA